MDPILNALPAFERPAWRAVYRTRDCSLLELLAAVIGGKRPIVTAQILLGSVDGPHGLMRAEPRQLAGIAGIGPATAARLAAAMELSRRLTVLSVDRRQAIGSPEAAAALLTPDLQDLEQEHLVVLLLDTRNRLLGDPVEVYRGSLNTSWVRIGEIFRAAIQANAAAIIMSHNHPSGDPTPSPEDVALTKTMVRAGKMLDIDVLDHLIIGRGSYRSLKARGLGFD